MSRYRRAKIDGGVLFFTLTLADRSSDLLVRHIDRLRRVYASVQRLYPFETIAICVLPDHLHAAWSLPPADANFPLRWSLIKSWRMIGRCAWATAKGRCPPYAASTQRLLDRQEIPPSQPFLQRLAQQIGRMQGGGGANFAAAGLKREPASARLQDSVPAAQ
jgi:REP element-mobilizing transposase RayT